MAGIQKYRGKVFPLNRENVDTDQIIPKQFLKKIDRQGFGKYLFYHWRFNDDGSPNPDFPLNNQQYRDATILLGGANFGCGSSREHAPWSIMDYGFKVVIAPSFADIFYNNCVKNGLLPIRLQQAEVDNLFEKASQSDLELFINLEEQTVLDQAGFTATFDIDPYWKQMLMNGWDEISITLAYEEHIRKYELTR
ncbi:MAG TPA: 3-isopropylmalate dehydratase small subunit [Bacillus sp. (in: firmicutes)]|uniref:3-isopropylmalate dehydratase small subunit n=1 Tax=Bacillus litorisediminis TaxID=2922713 RepID=UPI001FAD103E|nr:3-isopropylmalate dehydratase small subunit [Bacillus litorisediminis]HWO75441.1 3-isopropylmalate dehydratase small subunit [Bacillus sp. (in: firmicutes)]